MEYKQPIRSLPQGSALTDLINASNASSPCPPGRNLSAATSREPSPTPSALLFLAQADNDANLNTIAATNTMASTPALPNISGLSMADGNVSGAHGEPDDSIAAFWADAMDHGHDDIITAMKHNFDGTRLLTASSDHRVKVYHKVEGSDDQMELDDTWGAHAAEVRDADWGGYFTGTHIGTVGEDLKFKFWEEDTSQAYNSGLRFKCVFTAVSPTKQPWVSINFKQIDLDSWVALISRDGLLTVMEPSAPQVYTDWQIVDQFQVGPKPPRGEEASFKVFFHQDKHDITHALLGESQLKSLSLAVAAMDKVMVFRSHPAGGLYHAADLKGHGGLVRSVAWANGSARGYDLVATGCKDGKIRIFEVRTELASSERPSASLAATASTATTARPLGARSGIGEALGTPQVSDREQRDDGRVKHTVKQVACIESHWDVWQVGFEPYGDILATSGDDGAVRLWKKSVDGEWVEYAEVEAGDDE